MMTDASSGRERRAAADAARAEAMWGMHVLPDDRGGNPIELAHAAHARGDRMFQVDVPIGYTQANTNISLTSSSRTLHTATGDFLGAIEAIGWHLEHVSFTHAVLGHVESGNLQGGYHGTLVALYVFRRTPGS